MRYLKIFESYWGTIGAGIVPFCVNTKRFLIGLRSGYVMEPHTYGGFGGKLDIDEGVDETIEIAAKRELSEETGYYEEIELLKGYIFKDNNFEYHNFIGIVDEEFKPRLNWENDKAIWITYQELLELDRKHFGLERFLKESKDLFESLL
jgi:8-oxo-dGTP pyrophosphatase MutT (NUDIX family)